VISTYVTDDLLCVYYYFRALAVKHAFKNGEEILGKFLGKSYERWKADEGKNERETGDDIVLFKRQLLVAVSVLYTRAGSAYSDPSHCLH